MITRANKSIAGFKMREGMPIGCKVTLRGDRMYEFLDRLMTIALPRIRDFRGINPGSFDGRGNFAMGVREQIIFPEINYDDVTEVRGLNITITTTAPDDEQARELLRALGMPFCGLGKRNENGWQKKHSESSRRGRRSTRRAAITAAAGAAVRVRTTASSACAASACASLPTRA